MHWLLALLLLLPTQPLSPTQEKKLQEEGARELARKMRSDERFQRGRLLAQTVSHYRIGVVDFIREQQTEPEFADLVQEGYILSWASAGTRPMSLTTDNSDTRSFRLLSDNPLPEFAYLSYGLEHPQGGTGDWTVSWKWIPTNIDRVVHLAQTDPTPFPGRRRAIEIQLASPIELHYVLMGKMPTSYVQACTVTRMALLSTTPDRKEIDGLSLWVLPEGTRYATVWEEADSTQTVTVYGFPPDSLDARKADSKLTDKYVQIWPVPETSPALPLVGAQMLIEAMGMTMPKNDGTPGKVDITPIEIPMPGIPKS